MKDREEFINRECSLAVIHLKGVNIVWICGKENIIGEKEK